MCAGISATGVWTLAWVTAAYLAVSRAVASPDASAWLATGVALLMVAVHSWVVIRLLRRGRVFHQGGPGARSWRRPLREPWSSRILGYLAVVLLVGVAVAWNVGDSSVDSCKQPTRERVGGCWY
jgi:hypothetical protein